MWADTVNKAGGIAIGDKKYKSTSSYSTAIAILSTGADAASLLVTEEA